MAAVTEMDIQTFLEGYIMIHRTLWDRIPAQSHVRYFDKGLGPRADRFRPGGYVRGHHMDGAQKYLVIRSTDATETHVSYDAIDEVWKKYDTRAFIEIHLILASLAQKKKQIDTLQARVKRLEDIVAAL